MFARLMRPSQSGLLLRRRSYLSIEKVLSVARLAKCDAVHPGYGFLSENPNFAQEVEARGLVYIGPKPESIEQ